MARCCNSPVALEFAKGHWLSVYSARIPEAERPAAEMRTIVGDRPENVELPADIPNYRTPSGKFMWRLLKAWAAMGFRAPPIEATKGYAPLSKLVVERVEMLNIASPGHVVRVEKAKYDAMKDALLASVPTGEPGLTVAEIKARVLPCCPTTCFPAARKRAGG